MVTVVALISLFSAFALPTFFSERQYQEVADAVRKAQQIATSIDYGRAMGVVEPFEGSLAAFIADADNQVEDYMVVITDPFEFQATQRKSCFLLRSTAIRRRCHLVYPEMNSRILTFPLRFAPWRWMRILASAPSPGLSAPQWAVP